MKKQSNKGMTVSQKVARSKLLAKKGKRQWFREMKEEMRKVSWTTKEELIVCTKIVIGAMFALGFGIFFVDLFIRNIIHGLGYIIKWMG